MICIDGCMGASLGCKTQLRSGGFGDMAEAQSEALFICSKTLERSWKRFSFVVRRESMTLLDQHLSSRLLAFVLLFCKL